MKFIKFILTTVIFIVLFSFPINAQYIVYGKYKVGNLEFISYSPEWNNEKLNSLYIELLSNFHGDEFDYLSAVYLYPDSPYGVNGYYYEDISLKDGAYHCGNKAYIEIYNANKNNTIQKISRTLSHEYGHHYTIYNMILKEGKYYTQWSSSDYVKIRGLLNYPVYYSYNSVGNTYRWDVTEIMAEDYVQLLGSSIARMSMDYYDCAEMLEKGLTQSYNSTNSFNLMPQKNPYIPLAADVDGLYEYMYSLSGYKVESPPKSTPSEIISVDMNVNEMGKKEYTINWSEALGNEPYEYTLVMYPVSNPLVPIPLKTAVTGENLTAKIGNVMIKNEDNTNKFLSNNYEGDYEFVIYYKDQLGFIHKSEPYDYAFGYEEFIKDNTVGEVPDYVPNGEVDFSKINIDEDFDFEKVFNEFCKDFKHKVSFKSYYYGIIKGISAFFS